MYKCPLCSSDSTFLLTYRETDYFRCSGCSSVFVDPKNLPRHEDEKLRYLEHNNDVHDTGYRNFVRPIVEHVLETFSPNHIGLDFGAGTGPVISQMLKEKGFSIELYDPFFFNNVDLLNKEFDYIVSCEVIEHFHKPAKEFKQLKSMLKPGGELICKTDLLSECIDFSKWYYKDDPTHVFFYHKEAFEYIKKEFGFSDMQVSKRVVRFSY